MLASSLAYAPGANALPSYSGKSLFLAAQDINLVIECQWAPFEGEFTGNPGDATANPQVPPTVIQDVPAAHCAGYKADTYATNPEPYSVGDNDGDFHLTVTYTLAICSYQDGNNGHGNEICTQLDPSNPGNGGTTVSPGLSGVRCTSDGSGGSYLTYTAYCEEGVTVEGELTSIESSAPDWTNCSTTNGHCTLQLGGLPTTTKGKRLLIDSKTCEAFFPEDAPLALSQLLLYKEWYPGAACQDQYTPPDTDVFQALVGKSRYCDSGFGTEWNPDTDANDPSVAGLDDTFRGCVSTISTSTGEPVNHTASIEALAFQVEVSADFNPNSYNMNSCNDQGKVNVQLSTQKGIDVTRIAGVDPNGAIDPDKAPRLIPFDADSGTNEDGALSVPLLSATFSDQNADGVLDAVKLSYLTCDNPPTSYGLTELVQYFYDNGNSIIRTVGGTDTIDVKLQGTAKAAPGATVPTEFTAFDYDHKVVVPF